MSLLTLTSCASFGPKETSALAPQNQTVELPPAPADLAVCFDRQTPAPKAGKMTAQQLTGLIAAEKRLGDAKGVCGKRLICWYEDVARGQAPPDKQVPARAECVKLAGKT